jgi:O-succinylbenzoate synthase
VPIRLARVTVYSVELPLIMAFRTAHGNTTSRRTTIVRAEDTDGVVGWGEAPAGSLPTYTADTERSTWYALTELLVPLVLGRTFPGPADFALAWDSYQGYHLARHALECCAWTIASERLGRPLAELFGGEQTAILTGESFGIEEGLPALMREIENRLAQGFMRIKVKIMPGWDMDVLRAVAAAFPGVPLMADANTGYEPGGDEFAAIDDLGLLMLEQPFAGDALSELADLQARLRTRICLDESATTPGITRAALRIGAGRIVNVKPPRLAGPLRAMAVHDDCRERDVPVWCGGMFETGIGRGVNLALASLPGFTLPADMSPARLFYAEDLVDPTFDIQKDGTIPVPQRPGLGFPVAEKRIRRYAVDTWDSRAPAS